jgi:nucleoside-triphosphatase THEP1
VVINKLCHIFLTGERGIGKSTVVKKVWNFFVNNFPFVSIEGFLTKIQQQENNKRLLIFKSLGNKTELVLAENSKDNTGMVLASDGFENASLILKKIDPKEKFIIIDELGYLESHCSAFQTEVLRLIHYSRLSLVVVRKMKTPFLDKIRSNSRLIEVTVENREKIVNTIIDCLKINQ